MLKPLRLSLASPEDIEESEYKAKDKNKSGCMLMKCKFKEVKAKDKNLNARVEHVEVALFIDF